MAVPISNVTRRVVLAASGTGPYSFNFEILAAGDIAVYKDDTLLTITTDYTVTINANGTGYVTLTATPVGATQIAIVGDRTIQRTSDFTTGGDLFATTLNDELDSQTIFNQQNAEAVDRALKAPQTDPTTINMTLPRASVRANRILSFDATGNPSVTNTTTDVSVVAANIASINAVSAELGTGGDVTIVASDLAGTDTVGTVAGSIANVNTVAGISGNVTTVAGISANVTTVAGNSANVTTVAGSIANVNSVGGSIANVNSVAGQLGTGGDITTIAADLEGTDTIGTVATNIANVNSVGGSIASVNSVAGQLGTDGDITDVAANLTNIGTVAGISGNVTTVAGVAPNVTTVAGISSNVTTVAGISSNVTTVAGVAANVTTVAGISANVTTVAGISADVTTVAGDSADIQLLADNIASINDKVGKTSNTGSAIMPSGTEAERDNTPAAGYLRFNTDSDSFEGYNGTTWAPVGGGNTTTNGLWENANTISANYTIGSNNNGLSAGPITVNSGITVTVPSGSRWVVV